MSIRRIGGFQSNIALKEYHLFLSVIVSYAVPLPVPFLPQPIPLEPASLLMLNRRRNTVLLSQRRRLEGSWIDPTMEAA